MSLFKYKWVLAFLSGLLLWMSWYPHGFFFIIFIAFVPLFFLSDRLLECRNGVALLQAVFFSFLSFLIWNVGVTWWIWNSTPPGAVAAIVLNSFFMSCVFGIWQWVKMMKIPKLAIPVAFIAFWCSWEFLHLNWQLTWPWLNLGNGFAPYPKIVQWYEFTGVFGGTIWILIINFLCYEVVNITTHIFREKKSALIISKLFQLCAKKSFISLIVVLLTPILISHIRYHTYRMNQEKEIEVVIVQQNVDAWYEQYEKTNVELAALILKVAQPKLTPNTVFLVCPESALPHSINEEQLMNLNIYPHRAFQVFDTLFQINPKLNIVLGLSTYSYFDHKNRSTVREKPNGVFVEYYNTSCLYGRDTLQLYHKSRLVPGVEKMPYPKVFGFLEKIAIDLGGISGSLGADSEQRAFHATTDCGVIKIGVPICYESIFGELFSKFVKNGAQVMCVITNDAWWGESPGYKQHFEMSRLRAIETRRYILRAANTGISGFIDHLGEINQKTAYETRTAIVQTVYINDEVTFYTKHGDYLARIMLVLSVLILLFSIKGCSSFFGLRFKV